MDNLQKAKIHLLKLSKDSGYLVFDDIAEAASEFDIEDIDSLTAFLEGKNVSIYEDDEDAEENGEIVLWEEESDRIEAFKRYVLKKVESDDEIIGEDEIREIANRYEITLDDNLLHSLLSLLPEDDLGEDDDPEEEDDDPEEEDDADDCAKEHSFGKAKFFVLKGELTLFLDDFSMDHFKIPRYVRRIGNYAFKNCYGLKSLEIPDSVTSISWCAFVGCSSLISVSLPHSIKVIEDYTFDYCSSLPSIEIPDSVTSIGKGAFLGCFHLESVKMPKSLLSIGERAFKSCRSLSSIVIPCSVSEIGNDAFYECDSLTIYCEAKNQPEGWSDNWKNGFSGKIVWGYRDPSAPKDYEAIKEKAKSLSFSDVKEMLIGKSIKHRQYGNGSIISVDEEFNDEGLFLKTVIRFDDSLEKAFYLDVAIKSGAISLVDEETSDIVEAYSELHKAAPVKSVVNDEPPATSKAKRQNVSNPAYGHYPSSGEDNDIYDSYYEEEYLRAEREQESCTDLSDYDEDGSEINPYDDGDY